ncbi:unnamed protein product, partial [Ectocarpus fasciculatus]
MNGMWASVKDVAKHYWVGSKLLWADIKVAKNIMKRVLRGSELSRRERRQLIRTVQDVFRIVPLSIFVIVPFMELLLPFALKLFPNMLPSTFQDTLKKEEAMKKELAMRLAVADFMQETLHSIASRNKKKTLNTVDSSGAKEVIEFFEKAKFGEPLSNENVIRMARMFEDELTLENVSRPQLVGMCQFMKLNPYGTDSFLRFQLRTKINAIKEDDRRILWEGVDSLNEEELQDACQERGMRARGLTIYGYKKQLKGWIDLSIQKHIPISLLIMSRAFVIHQSLNPETVLRDSLSSLDEDIINEVVIEAAQGNEKDSLEIRQRRLESIEFQQEVREREEEEEADTTKKESDVSRSTSSSGTGAKGPDSGSTSKIKESKDHYVGSRLVEGEIRPGDTATAEILADAIDEAVGAGKLGQDKLTVAELQLLDDISRGSVVSTSAGAEASSVRESARTNNEGMVGSRNDDTDDDTEIDRMRRVLDSMLGKLQSRIQAAEQALDGKIQLLDEDRDGIISSSELKDTMKKILKRYPTDAEAEAFVLLLDEDRDG